MSVYQLKYMDSVPGFRRVQRSGEAGPEKGLPTAEGLCKRRFTEHCPKSFNGKAAAGKRTGALPVCALFHAGVDRETVDQRLWHGADGERAAGIFAGDTGYNPYQSSEDHTGSAGKAVERGRRYRRENGLRR